MKFILLASASLLCAPSVWATEYPEYPLGPLPEKVVADSRENGVYAKTSGISQSIGGLAGLPAQPGRHISSALNMTVVAQNATPVPTPFPGAAKKRAPGEATDEKKRMIRTKISR